MSHQNRNHNLEQQSAHIEQHCAHFNSNNLEHRNHVDSCSANFEQRIHSHDFSDSLEQRNHVNNFYANLEQSTHLKSSSSSCCQPLKHHGRHGEPLYKSLLRPHRWSQAPYMDYIEGAHHLHHHECTFEAENSAVGDCLPHQFTDCTTCRFGFPALPENNTSMGSVSKGQNYFSFRALSNEITLYNWYLIRCNGSHPSEIAVGGFLSSRGMDNERIETSTIVKRLEQCKVLTKDGNVVNLLGPIDDYRTVSNGFSLQTVHSFISGFPHIWNLMVGMGLPAKGAGTNIASRSYDFYGGEVTSQVTLQKDFQFQGKCMHQSSVPEGRENEMASCLEVERHHGFKFASKESQGVEAVAKVPESVVLQELQEQVNTLLDGKSQSSGDQPPSTVQVHEKQDKSISPVRTESDKETELARDFVKERSQHEASYGQKECTANQMVEVMGLSCELENMPIESVEVAMAESRSEDMKPESVTKISIKDSTQEEKQDSKAFVESRADANKPLDLHDNSGTVEISDVMLELASLHSPEISDCYTQSRMAKMSKCSHSSLSRKRKVVFNIPDVVETEHPSCTSLSLETSTKGLERSCSKGAEPVSSMKSVDIVKSTVNKTVTAKQKGKRKKKGRFLLPKYKRSTKPMVKFDICENTKDGKGEQEVCNEEGLGAGCKGRKSTTRIRKSTDEQSGAILSMEQPLSPNKTAEGEALSPNKTAEGEASITALVLEPIINRRVETRQRVNEKSHVKEAAPKKMIAKKQHTLKQTRAYDDSSQMESNDLVISTIGIQKVETKIKDSLKVDSRRWKSGEADFDIHLGTSKRRKEKPLKKIEIGDLEDSTCGKETSEGYCNTQAHTECDSGPSTKASARKRLKQILPPPLPLPLVSVSKQLVSKAFGLKTSRSGRLLVPPLAHWRGQSLVRDMDGGIIAIEDGSQDATREDTGCFNFKPPIEARAKKLQKWLCETATECLTKKLKARKKASSHKQKCISLSQP